ncbi:type VII secretion system-associated protein [Streptomyces sp. NPDC057245]|uniref:type VII secretion system-associated protein n=1 Tax=Streptomyces TaxID=1883 RepID=UPI001C1DD3C0|nr:type VII secretion system-associated protein [Streptomyces sp. A108]MBU6536267.1 type VII secretion system-associated protein [Streptomyces sp. A108]
MSPQEDTLPPVPDDIREAGRRVPEHWLGVVDPMWSGPGSPPDWAVTGRWRSGPDGEIVEWQENPDYRPSPRALGWPEPEDEVDRAVQLATTGYGPGEAVPATLVGHEVAVLTAPDGGLLCAVAPGGTPVVPLFTSPVFLHTAGRYAFELVAAEDVVARVPGGHALYLNPSAPVSMLLDPDVVRDAVRDGTDGRADAGSGDAGGTGRLLTEGVRPVRGADA